jgi:predicted solute-binding protein
MTGLPFVFALWAARSEAVARRAGTLIESALDIGLRAVASGALARRAELPKMKGGELEDYLTRNIHYVLGVEEQKSLRDFFRLCREEGALAGGATA